MYCIPFVFTQSVCYYSHLTYIKDACYNWQTNTDTLMFAEVCSLYWSLLWALHIFVALDKWMLSCIYYYIIIWNSFNALKFSRALTVPKSLEATDILLFLSFCLFQDSRCCIWNHPGCVLDFFHLSTCI